MEKRDDLCLQPGHRGAGGRNSGRGRSKCEAITGQKDLQKDSAFSRDMELEALLPVQVRVDGR